MLTEGTKFWNWEKFGTLTVQECVDVMQGIVDTYYASECGDCTLPEGGDVIGLDAEGKFKQLKDGEWVTPEGVYELPPLPAREEPTSEERRCLASANAASVLEQLYEDMTDSYNLDVDPYIAFTQWIGLQSTIILVAIGFLSFGVGVILFGTWTLAYQALEFLTEDVWNSAFTEKLVCVLYRHATDNDGVITFNYRGFLNDLQMNIDLGDPSVGELRLYAQIVYMLFFLGADGLNFAGATTGITSYDCTLCGCEDEDWEHTFDFTIDEQGWVATNGSYVDGVGWTNSTFSTSWRLLMSATFGMECPSSIIGIEASVTGTQEQSRVVSIYQAPGGSPAITFVDSSNTPITSPFGGAGTPFEASTALGMYVLMDNPTANSFYVTNVRVWGHGAEPDWSF